MGNCNDRTVICNGLQVVSTCRLGSVISVESVLVCSIIDQVRMGTVTGFTYADLRWNTGWTGYRSDHCKDRNLPDDRNTGTSDHLTGNWHTSYAEECRYLICPLNAKMIGQGLYRTNSHPGNRIHYCDYYRGTGTEPYIYRKTLLRNRK